MRTYTLTVGAEEAGQRLDRYLTAHLPNSLSRAMIQRSIRDGAVTIGNRPAKANQKVRQADQVIAAFTQLGALSRGLDMKPQAIPLDIVYEDEALLVVNKPAGLVTHPAPGHWDGTLVNAILWHLGHGDETDTRERAMDRAGIVHRLDKDTSGLLLVAKTELSHIALSRQLKARLITRRYLALLEGHLPLQQGTVDVPIGRHALHRKEMTVRHFGGRHAVTHYRVLKRGTVQGFECSVIEAALETGRTHQIRVHMAHLGHPVAGDLTYGKRSAAFWQQLGIARQMLHAYRLSFQHPVTGRTAELRAPIPQDMAVWIDYNPEEKEGDP